MSIQLDAIDIPFTTSGAAEMDSALQKVSSSAEFAGHSTRTLAGGLAAVSLESVGLTGPLARISEGLVVFGGGHAALLLVATALAAVAVAVKLIGDNASEASKNMEAFTGELAKQGKMPTPFEPRQLEAAIQSQQDLLKRLEAQRDEKQKQFDLDIEHASRLKLALDKVYPAPEMVEEVGRQIRVAFKPPEGLDELRQQILNVEQGIFRLKGRVEELRLAEIGKGTAENIKFAAEQVAALNAALERTASPLEKYQLALQEIGDRVRLYGESEEIANRERMSAAESYTAEAEAIERVVNAVRGLANAQPTIDAFHAKQKADQQAISTILEHSLSPLEKYHEDVQKLTDAYLLGTLGIERYLKGLDDLRNKLGKKGGILDIGAELAAGATEIATAFGNVLGGAASGYTSLGNLIESVIGKMLTSIGTALIALGTGMLAAKLSLANPFAAIAAGFAMVALGAAFSAAANTAISTASSSLASGSAAGGGGGFTSSFGISGLQSTGDRLTSVTLGGGGYQAPAAQAPLHVTIIGPNDPSAQRQVTALLAAAGYRGL